MTRVSSELFEVKQIDDRDSTGVILSYKPRLVRFVSVMPGSRRNSSFVPGVDLGILQLGRDVGDRVSYY